MNNTLTLLVVLGLGVPSPTPASVQQSASLSQDRMILAARKKRKRKVRRKTVTPPPAPPEAEPEPVVPSEVPDSSASTETSASDTMTDDVTLEEPSTEPTSAPEAADADTDPGSDFAAMATPTDKAIFGTFSLGVGGNLSDSTTQFKLDQAVGYHLLTRDMTGLAVGGALSESLGNDLFVFQIGGRVWWDILLLDDLGLYVAPMAQLGLAIVKFTGDLGPFADQVDTTDVAFNLMVGAEGRLALKDSWVILLRPVTLDIFMGDGTGIRYDFLLGGGMLF